MTQTFGTFYNADEHDTPPRISHIQAYVNGNYNPEWRGCQEITVEGDSGKKRNRKARQERLEFERRGLAPQI